jgi:transposase
MQVAVLGIDLGKNSCGVVGQDSHGRVVLRWRVRRNSLLGLAKGPEERGLGGAAGPLR